jgi:hypothetical protein
LKTKDSPCKAKVLRILPQDVSLAISELLKLPAKSFWNGSQANPQERNTLDLAMTAKPFLCKGFSKT